MECNDLLCRSFLMMLFDGKMKNHLSINSAQGATLCLCEDL